MTGWRDDISKLLVKIGSKKESEFFREPVDWEAMGLTDYPIIITQPMDLRTARERLEADYYDSALEAAADIRLIFLNAMTYNAPGSRVYVYAKTLSDFWETSCANIIKMEEDVDRPASVEEMTHWVDKCHRISAEDLGRVLKLLDNICPNCLVKRSDTNEVEVNVDLLNGKAFREAAALTNTILPDIVLASSSRRSLAKSSAAASAAAAGNSQGAATAAEEHAPAN
uniref:Bromo domain-containing protein n=1 Tax=Spumella elongata TaxID=89044 RepID=A0A7S3HR85_9STRA